MMRIFIQEATHITLHCDFPETLCDGRTVEQFDSEGTGTGLWIQNGTDPEEDSVRMPETQDEANKSAWTQGSCFITMGIVYWSLERFAVN